MEVGRGDVKLNDVEVANGRQGEGGMEGFQTQYGRRRFSVIDTRTLVVASSNESTFIPPKNAILEVSDEIPS